MQKDTCLRQGCIGKSKGGEILSLAQKLNVGKFVDAIIFAELELLGLPKAKEEMEFGSLFERLLMVMSK